MEKWVHLTANPETTVPIIIAFGLLFLLRTQMDYQIDAFDLDILQSMIENMGSDLHAIIFCCTLAGPLLQYSSELLEQAVNSIHYISFHAAKQHLLIVTADLSLNLSIHAHFMVYPEMCDIQIQNLTDYFTSVINQLKDACPTLIGIQYTIICYSIEDFINTSIVLNPLGSYLSTHDWNLFACGSNASENFIIYV